MQHSPTNSQPLHVCSWHIQRMLTWHLLQAGALDVFVPAYHLRGRVNVVDTRSGLVRLPLTGGPSDLEVGGWVRLIGGWLRAQIRSMW
jgi:hypothetical protein